MAHVDVSKNSHILSEARKQALVKTQSIYQFDARISNHPMNIKTIILRFSGY